MGMMLCFARWLLQALCYREHLHAAILYTLGQRTLVSRYVVHACPAAVPPLFTNVKTGSVHVKMVVI
jgi:hypothetical protein